MLLNRRSLAKKIWWSILKQSFIWLFYLHKNEFFSLRNRNPSPRDYGPRTFLTEFGLSCSKSTPFSSTYMNVQAWTCSVPDFSFLYGRTPWRNDNLVEFQDHTRVVHNNTKTLFVSFRISITTVDAIYPVVFKILDVQFWMRFSLT